MSALTGRRSVGAPRRELQVHLDRGARGGSLRLVVEVDLDEQRARSPGRSSSRCGRSSLRSGAAGRSATSTSTGRPGAAALDAVCGTLTKTRRRSDGGDVEELARRAAASCPTSTSWPMSVLRAVITPSNGASIRSNETICSSRRTFARADCGRRAPRREVSAALSASCFETESVFDELERSGRP